MLGPMSALVSLDRYLFHLAEQLEVRMPTNSVRIRVLQGYQKKMSWYLLLLLLLLLPLVRLLALRRAHEVDAVVRESPR